MSQKKEHLSGASETMWPIDPQDKNYQLLRRMFDPVYEELINKIKRYNPNYNGELLERAYQFSLWAHRNQFRKSGEPYFEHCIYVALVLADMLMDSTTIAAGMLHDVIEDTEYTREDIEENFGPEIALLVDGVTKIAEISGRKNLSYETRQAETFRKMLLSMARDLRVIIIKLADRLHNMRTLHHVPVKSRQRIALETRDVYAPLAHRFGMAKIKSELEDLAFKYLDHKAYNELSNRLNQNRQEREAYIRKFIEPIRRELEEHGIRAEIYGRPKHLYSIHRKMQIRNKPFEEIYDLFAIRIIVRKVEECYYVLGLVHNRYTPVHDRFKDYIAMPKMNGYQSLHTTVVDDNGHLVEIQIRTQEMHRVAEMGIAAHWRYKEEQNGRIKRDPLDEQLDWIRQFLEEFTGSETVDAKDFLESLKIDLYQDEVFVFSPKGDVYRLPRGATPVDFAFAVHTKVGLHCIGAKVNDRIVPLKYELNSGEVVEIITSANQHPRQDWLTFVKTSKARHHIRKYLREVQFEHSVKLGEEIIQKYFERFKIKDIDASLAEAAKKLHFDDPVNLKAAIGRGDVSIEKVVSAVSGNRPQEERENLLKKLFQREKGHYPVQVQGMDNIMVHFGKCCSPVPGDDIIGYVTQGKGVTVHRTTCPNMLALVANQDRTIQVDWTVETDEEFRVQLSILAEDRKHMIRDIAQAISNNNTNIIHLDIRSKDNLGIGKLIIEVKNLSHLTRVIKALNGIKGMISVERVDSASRKRFS
ncbi:MAG: bifunctional (p)ppGpp synthetase/guanosine-3',5'-bis(diphosphate) 3'-pyrophosphohydrolase [Calditrichaeota bacterium]|nr:MAG: bifunctional (p)ppGpp synthetase/guanosine-3',5'-bis(diphosphate) 3'-pyrophosphohydrolase [Calditrichota bacterium]